MDRRSESRILVDNEATVTVLGGAPATYQGRIVNATGRGLRVLLEADVPANSAVTVAVGDDILLGEVCYCNAEGDSYAIGLQLEQSLSQVAELARYVERLIAGSDAHAILSAPLPEPVSKPERKLTR